MLIRILYIASFAIALLLTQGCEKDKSIVAPVINIEQGAELLQLLEGKGDYVNNSFIPFISADELYLKKDSVVIIDVRRSSDYLDGHIEGALNISSSLLFDSLTALNTGRTIVLISGTGEASAYYTFLLRVAGLNNVFTLNFGMGSWNNYFAKVWLDRLRDYPEASAFTTEIKEKDSLHQLPDPGLDRDKSIEESMLLKIKDMIASGFTEETNSNPSIASVYFDDVADELHKYHIICAGPRVLYYSYLLGTYHLNNSMNYLTFPYLSDFRSTSYLQSLPDKQQILVYSGSGQESAFITAYLRLLGYNASSILLGCNNFSHSMLNVTAEIRVYQFNNSVVKSYPYIK